MKHRTSIELSQSAFTYNIDQIKQAVGETAIALVVKSNAYGHGLKEIAQMAQADSRITWFCTAGISEALALRAQGITKPIIVLSYLDDNLEQAIKQDVHVTLYNLEDAYALNAAAQRIGKKASVHIKIDTGMSRLGIHPEDAFSFIGAVKACAYLELYGIFTHLNDTPNPNQSFSYHQLKTFDDLIELIEAAGITIPCIHAQSSSSLCVQPARPYTFIRAGAAAYGIWKSEEHRQLIKKLHPDFNLKQIMQWKTQIIHLKEIPKGASVGYDRTWKAERPTRLAIAPIGYADGYARELSNRGIAHIQNHYAPVVGIVSMNMTAFDVTDIPNVHLYDDIILLSDIPGITAHESARSAHIITNDLTTHINTSIERTIVPSQVETQTSPSEQQSVINKKRDSNPLHRVPKT